MSRVPVSAADAQRFYRAGVMGLCALQALGLGAERFSPNASARWRAFAGELTDSQRLDLLLRDGAARHPAAFAARSVFALAGLAHDEPFGPSWVSQLPSQAGAILREGESAAVRGSMPIRELLSALADVWGLSADEPERTAVSQINAASRLVAAGAGAIIAVAVHMQARKDCDLGDQLLVVTDQPGLRQLAGIAAAVSGSRKAPRCVTPTDRREAAVAAGFERATLCIVAPDAAPAEAAAARALAAELGG